MSRRDVVLVGASAGGVDALRTLVAGLLDDGSAGLVAVRARGGPGIVQDPADAPYPGMPASAVAAARPEHVLPVAAMDRLLGDLVQQRAPAPPAPPALLEQEGAITAFDAAALGAHEHPGTPSAHPRPECAGVTWRIEEGGLLRSRCRGGHAWSAGSFLAEQATAVDPALWTALRSREDRAALTRETARRAHEEGRALTSAGSTAGVPGGAPGGAAQLQAGRTSA